MIFRNNNLEAEKEKFAEVFLSAP